MRYLHPLDLTHPVDRWAPWDCSRTHHRSTGPIPGTFNEKMGTQAMTTPAHDTRMPSESPGRVAMINATKRLRLRFAIPGDELDAVLARIDTLSASGCNEQEMMLIAGAVIARVQANFHPRTCEQDAARHELEADLKEDRAEGTMYLEGRTPTTLDLRAEALETQGASSFVLARLCRNAAAQLRQLRTTAQQRMGAVQ